MDADTARDKITAYKKRVEMEKAERENAYKNDVEKLVGEIKDLKVRIEKILEIGNLCLENGINLNPLGTYRKCLYEEDAFESDGIYHQLGFYPNHYQGHPLYKCSHYDFIGYVMGGANGNTNFITNGSIVAGTPDDNSFEIKEMSEPLVKHMQQFLKDFPGFEEAFYGFIEKL